jgi:hypothetical protein
MISESESTFSISSTSSVFAIFVLHFLLESEKYTVYLYSVHHYQKPKRAKLIYFRREVFISAEVFRADTHKQLIH